VDKVSLSTNLRRLRISRGKTQEDVARMAELSRVGYRAIETGAVEPKIDSLERIARVFDVSIAELLVPARRLQAVRFRAQKKMTTREQVLAEVAGWLADYNELEAMVGEKVAFPFAALVEKTSALEGPDRPKKAAAIARQAFDLSMDGHEDAVRDICGLLEAHGVKVITPTVASEGFFGLSVAADDGGPAVLVNVWERISVERWIFTAAHELGHLLLHPEAFTVTRADEVKREEREADVFASNFLMPQILFEKAWRETAGLRLLDRVLGVKRIFRVSYRTVLYRLADDPNAKNIWMRIQVEHRNRFGKTLGGADEPQRLRREDFRMPGPRADEPERLREADFVKGRLSRLVRAAVEKKKITFDRAAEILGIEHDAMAEYARSWV
jgi:Zn-dependent peptidase ImmA (M78 family)/transcriptional regulator with XRE-family HTH domain